MSDRLQRLSPLNILRFHGSIPSVAAPYLLQRACMCGNHTAGEGECEEYKAKRQGILQRSTTNTISVSEEVPPIVHEGLNSPSQPLDANTRTFIEPRFGHNFSKVATHTNRSVTTPAQLTIGEPHDEFEQEADLAAHQTMGQSSASNNPAYDFSGVRIHTDDKAAASARAVNASAYTVGQDIVFGRGQYAPSTIKGRQLLAHELAHVVQQNRGIVVPAIQRHMLVTGNKADIDAMRRILEPSSDLTLKHDPKTKEISVVRNGGNPKSPELAEKLLKIIDDPKQNAELHLGRKNEKVSVGEFPMDTNETVQDIRIDHIVALEKGAPGAGVAKLAHEIVENYHLHALLNYDRKVAFDMSHDNAEKTENLIQSQLGHPGNRRAQYPVALPSGRIVRIQDNEQYFLVWDIDDRNTISNARRLGRVKVSTHTLDGFNTSSTTVPKGAEAMISTLTTELKNEPTASALFEGYASIGHTDQEKIKHAKKWIEIVQEAILAQPVDSSVTNLQRFYEKNSPSKTSNCVVITLERPLLDSKSKP